MIVQIFAGPGGWCSGVRMAGYTGQMVGLEHCIWACRTAKAAGHDRICADVATYPTHVFTDVDGLIGSPPCQPFSSAGNRKGLDDPRGQLVMEPLRWAKALMPRWIACEQVPEVLPVWRMIAHDLRPLGYSTWTGLLLAADYGVPQTRLRAYLIARRDGVPAAPPAATHSAAASDDSLFGGLKPWVSMGEALGREGLERPARTVAGNRGPRWAYGPGERSYATGWTMMSAGRTGQGRPRRMGIPAATITGKATAAWVKGSDSAGLTHLEAAILQGFPPGYPWRGNSTERFRQIGDAVCPPVAAAIIGPLLAHLRERAA